MLIDTRSGDPGTPPLDGRLARLFEHPAPDGHDQAGLFRDLDEIGRHHEAAGGMGPAQERLVAHGRAVRRA